MEKILLTDILVAIAGVIDNQGDDKAQAALDLLKSKIVVREYLRNVEKLATLEKVMVTSSEEDSPAYAAMEFANAEVLQILLSYTNIENDLSDSVYNNSAIDWLYQFGVLDMILSVCQKDYDRIIAIFHQSIDLTNLQIFTTSLANYDLTKVDEVIYKWKELQKELTPEALQTIKEANFELSPSTAALSKAIENAVIHKTLKNNDIEVVENKDKKN